MIRKLLCAGLLFSASYADIHGLVDIAFKNDYITPRGLLVTDTGLTVQVLNTFAIDICKSVTGNFGAWNDIWTAQGDPYVGAWNEFDWFVGATLSWANHWKFFAQFLQFVSPPHHFRPENNAEFVLSFEDGSYNPYLKLFWAISGDSTIVVGNPGKTYYVEIGFIPTYKWPKVIFTLPTALSFGPAHFWNGGKLALKNSHSHFGIFTTAINLRIPLGAWYISVGGQYYRLINENLLQAQKFTIGVHSLRSAHRNVLVGSFNVGFEF
jgi:hypothetical protein